MLRKDNKHYLIPPPEVHLILPSLVVVHQPASQVLCFGESLQGTKKRHLQAPSLCQLVKTNSM